MLCVFALFCSGSILGAEADTIDALFSSINERLSYMEEVALYKAQNQIAIEDIPREQIVIANSMEAAGRLGLDPQSLNRFFVSQINAAKAIQYRYRAELLIQPLPQDRIDLQQNIRPALDELGERIVELIASALNEGIGPMQSQRQLFDAAIDHRLLSTEDRQALFSALLEVRLRE